MPREPLQKIQRRALRGQQRRRLAAVLGDDGARLAAAAVRVRAR